MRNQETWDFGNLIGAKMMLWVGVSSFIVGIIAHFIAPLWSMGISTFFLVVAIFLGIFWCERQLEIHFDKNGKPLNKGKL
ncbi:SdpI family protein [Arenibacter aquaticus]|uniref:SdpI family protein n=2 Tax=Arenibacter aquaticus TaxID=2489054 RepID=A0A430K8Y7_9FLAO|nr:SdpI family protein [Arenibacter aquaticus]